MIELFVRMVHLGIFDLVYLVGLFVDGEMNAYSPPKSLFDEVTRYVLCPKNLRVSQLFVGTFNCQQVMKSIAWRLPQVGTLKLNTDGALSSEGNKASTGGCYSR